MESLQNKAAKSFEDVARRILISGITLLHVVYCFSLLICVFCCFYSWHLKPLYYQKANEKVSKPGLYYTAIEHSRHLRTLKKITNVQNTHLRPVFFFISIMFSNACCIHQSVIHGFGFFICYTQPRYMIDLFSDRSQIDF